MNDIVFYPLAALIALGIIAAAALPGKDRLGCSSVSGAGTNYNTVRVEGNDLCRMKAAGQSDIERILVGDEISSIWISAGAGLLGDRPDRNPHFRLARDLEFQFSDRRIKVTIVAKPASDHGALAFEANYSAGPEGNSGWHTFKLVPEYRAYSFTYDVPLHTTAGETVDYLAIRPVVPQKTRAVDIKSVTFERLKKTKKPEQAEE